jgi:ribosomal protein S18 acetylase RimI-like enzyme
MPQENNEDAVRFYTRKGFSVGPKVENYYKRIQPRGAFVVHKSVRS